MSSEAPPLLADFTTSSTCLALTPVNTLTSSGMTAPARVPKLMISDRIHHRFAWPSRPESIRNDMTKVRMIETIEVIQTSEVSGVSNSISSASSNVAFAHMALPK